MDDCDALDGTRYLPPRANAHLLGSAASYARILAFMAVASEGSFANAARRLGIGRSAVSRSVRKLEAELGTRLFLRTTRATTLTREGQRFFENCHRGVTHIVGAMNDLLDLRVGPPRGLVRIRSSIAFGRKIVAPLLDKFIQTYPDIEIELLLDDRPTDFASDHVDVAFRSGRVEDPSLIARQLLPIRMAVVAAPSYAEIRGLPDTPEELPGHKCINYRFWNGQLLEWEFWVDGFMRKFQPPAQLTFNDFDLVLQAALQGHGIAQLEGCHVRTHIEAGNLVLALPGYATHDRWHYLCYLSRQHLPVRIRVFIDFMIEQIRELECGDFGPFNDRTHALLGIDPSAVAVVAQREPEMGAQQPRNSIHVRVGSEL